MKLNKQDLDNIEDIKAFIIITMVTKPYIDFSAKHIRTLNKILEKKVVE